MPPIVHLLLGITRIATGPPAVRMEDSTPRPESQDVGLVETFHMALLIGLADAEAESTRDSPWQRLGVFPGWAA